MTSRCGNDDVEKDRERVRERERESEREERKYQSRETTYLGYKPTRAISESGKLQ